MQFIKKNNLQTLRDIIWEGEEPKTGMRSISSPSLPMMRSEADTFREMIKFKLSKNPETSFTYEIKE